MKSADFKCQDISSKDEPWKAYSVQKNQVFSTFLSVYAETKREKIESAEKTHERLNYKEMRNKWVEK